MSLAKLNDESVRIIRNLSDYPNQNDNLTGEELREKFDQAAENIKNFLNDGVVPEVNALCDHVKAIHSASYKITGSGKQSKWCRIANISRTINGTLNLDLWQGAPSYMVQNVCLDISGYVRWEGDTKTANPVIVQKYNNIYGVNGVVTNPLKQSRIKKVRIAYPKRGVDYGEKGEFPIQYEGQTIQTIGNPVYCYVDALIEFDRNYTVSASPCLSVNFMGVPGSHCDPITEQTVVNDSTVGTYGEQLDFYEFELNPDIDFYMPKRKMQVKEIYAENLEPLFAMQKQYEKQYEEIKKITLDKPVASIDLRGYNFSALRVYVRTPAVDYNADIIFDIRNSSNARICKLTLGNAISPVPSLASKTCNTYFTFYNDFGMCEYYGNVTDGILKRSSDSQKSWENVQRVYLTASANIPAGSVITIFGVKE